VQACSRGQRSAQLPPGPAIWLGCQMGKVVFLEASWPTGVPCRAETGHFSISRACKPPSSHPFRRRPLGDGIDKPGLADDGIERLGHTVGTVYMYKHEYIHLTTGYLISFPIPAACLGIGFSEAADDRSNTDAHRPFNNRWE
jgi:hypothetical protein